ncbi:MAG: hypothetical protein ACE5HS_04425 [bacterium]
MGAHKFNGFITLLRIVCSAAVLIGCGNLPTESAGSSRLPIRGITLVDWTASGYKTASAQLAINEIAATGANHLAIIVTAYQTQVNSDKIFLDANLTPRTAAVEQALFFARSLGLEVSLKPHVDLVDGAWRGHIQPRHPEKWFESYASFILPLAETAQKHRAAQFIIGTELAGTLTQPALWQNLIHRIKQVFDGDLIYAASWDEASRVPFWNELTFIGVDFYFPVSNRRNPSRFEILAGWQPWLNKLELLHQQTGQVIILTEIGYRSVDGAGMQPFEFTRKSEIDLAEQADLYWAALEATSSLTWLKGLYWWNWPADGSGGSGNTDFSPARKPAANELSKSWR